jgi:hypothetical protein
MIPVSISCDLRLATDLMQAAFWRIKQQQLKGDDE